MSLAARIGATSPAHAVTHPVDKLPSPQSSQGISQGVESFMTVAYSSTGIQPATTTAGPIVTAAINSRRGNQARAFDAKFIVIKIIDAVDLWRRLIEEAVNISRT